MAITKVGAMTDPPVAGDYAILQAKLDAYAKQIGNQGMILTQWVNTTTTPAIALGSYITHGGTLFVVDTEDFVVQAPAGNGTYYLKVATSGATLAISWVASTAGYAWNSIYNGLYHADESQILPYQLVKAGATLTKRKITNLMQGSGFVTVDYLGAITGSGPIVATSLDTGQGANELYGMDQGVKTTDSPLFSKLGLSANSYEPKIITSSTTENISAMAVGEVKFIRITLNRNTSGNTIIKTPLVGTSFFCFGVTKLQVGVGDIFQGVLANDVQIEANSDGDYGKYVVGMIWRVA